MQVREARLRQESTMLSEHKRTLSEELEQKTRELFAEKKAAAASVCGGNP